MLRRIVFIDPLAFGLGWLGSAQRYFKMAQALGDLGWESSIVARRDHSHKAVEAEAMFPGRVFRTPFGTVPAPMDHHVLRNVWWRLEKWLDRTPGYETWPGRLVRWQGRYEPPSPLASAHVLCAVSFLSWEPLVAVRSLATELGIPYWIDIRDPLLGTKPSKRPSLSDEQALSLADSERIVATTDLYTQHLRELFPEHAGKFLCIRSTHNAFAASAEDRTAQDNRLNLVSAGLLRREPDVSAVPAVRAIARLYEQVPTARGRLRLRLFGDGPGMSQAAREARSLGVGESVQCLRPVHPKKLQTELDSADVLCIFMPATDRRRLHLPGKTYDYLFSTKPILAVTRPGELSDIIRDTRSGFAVDPSDVNGLASTLGRLLEAKEKHGSVAMKRDPARLKPYSFDTFRQKLRSVMIACDPTANAVDS